MSVEASYVPGDNVVVAGRRLWAMFRVDSRAPFVATCWTAVRDGATAQDVLGHVLEVGFGAVPAFAIAEFDGEAGRVLLRGALSATLEATPESNTAPVVIDGDSVPTWRDEAVPPGTCRVRLRNAEASGVRADLPLGGGVIMASVIELRRHEASSRTAEPPNAQRPPEHPRIGQAPAQTAVGPEAPASDETPRSLDYLFGATIPPDQAVVAPRRDGNGGSELQANPVAERSSLTLPPPVEPDSSRLPADGLIDALPWLAKPTPVPIPPVAQPGPRAAAPLTAAEADRPKPVPADPAAPADTSASGPAITVTRASLAAAIAAAGPTVLARRCAAGHLSPAFGPACRVCAQPIPDQEAFDTPRPPLGVLRLSGGDEVVLDRNVLMGRQPEIPAAAAAADRPHVVQLNNPGNDISRTHLEVTLDGWHTMVTDLGSTNGTVITQPGHPAERMRPHDPVVIAAGTVVSLADDVSFTFEVDR